MTDNCRLGLYHIKKSSHNNIPISSFDNNIPIYRFGGEQHFAGFFKFFSKTTSTKMSITFERID